ncbi:MAG: malic protein NAD-binding protein, partial [Frankiales bacterium]|nr:malic protein NAD-binding protein [Frankiales bacterium]
MTVHLEDLSMTAQDGTRSPETPTSTPPGAGTTTAAADPDLDAGQAARDADPVFALHRGGKVEVVSRVSVATREELSLAYTPGVAKVCTAIAEQP